MRILLLGISDDAHQQNYFGMSRIVPTKNQSISLFPVFNILICTLGVLIFIFSTMGVFSLGMDINYKFNIPLPAGGKNEKRPVPLTWDGKSLVLLSSGSEVIFPINIGVIDTYKKTYDYLDSRIMDTPLSDSIQQAISQKEHMYFLVFVRPSGFHNFNDIKTYIQSKGLDVGYEPVKQVGNIKVEYK
ncbi:MAG: hypothetical protein R2824_29675 [Saprospiraceae bacterium]